MSQQPRKFLKINGVISLNPEYLAWKKNGGTKSSAPAAPWQDPIDKIMVELQIIQGQDLVAKDRNMFGKKISSDPYVCISLLCTPSTTVPGKTRKVQKIQLGRTKTIKKNLNPEWNYSQTYSIPFSRKNDTLQLVFEIFDEDKVSTDDSMGVVKLQPIEWKDKAGSAIWHEIPKGSAKKVSGSIQTKISTSLHRVQGLKPYC